MILKNDKLHVKFDDRIPIVTKYLYIPTNETFSAGVFTPVLIVNNQSITFNEFDISVSQDSNKIVYRLLNKDNH